VLLVANTLPPRDLSGVGEQVLQLAAGLREIGSEVEVLGRGPGGVAGPKILFPLLAVPAVRRAVRRWRPHVVQVHESDGALAALLLRWFPLRRVAAPQRAALLQVSYREERRAVRELVSGGQVLGRPGPQERRFRRFKAPLQIALGWLTVRAVERVLAPSAATAAELKRDYGVREVAVVPNAAGERRAERDAEPVEEPGFLLFVGRLRIRKGVEVLLAALARLRHDGVRARLLIAGDGEHREALERRVAELSLGEQVQFIGRASAGRVHALMGGAAGLVVPSIYEGMPLVVLEAMEEGLPVVASAVSGIPEVVRGGETGWLVPAEDPAALAAALGELLADPAERQRRGAAGRRRVEELYRPATVARRWYAALFDRRGEQGGNGGTE
jgi:glycosyltransferase involved in cell wall biosynthesis